MTTSLRFDDFEPTQPLTERQWRHAYHAYEMNQCHDRALIYVLDVCYGLRPRLDVLSRAARVRLAPGSATPAQVQARVAYYGGLCWICSAPYQAVDHVKPIAKGGSKWPANLRPICTSCNSSKGAKWPFEAAA